ncbi:MAG: class I SAM-dependent methyltransferase [Acetobacteraceae bacterium]|nr:class I SAM-dependent methyltransferase [Acetobacteraceae bacterium]
MSDAPAHGYARSGWRSLDPEPDPDLVQRLNSLLPERPRLLDLTPGGTSLLHTLAPLIARPQVWTCVDTDDAHLGVTFNTIADWAEEEGYTVTWPGRVLIVHSHTGAWRVEGLVHDLAESELDDLPLSGAHAVVCAGLFDRVSASWIDALGQALRCPLLACLVPDGRDLLTPQHPLDRLITAALRRAGVPDIGDGPSLGDAAPETAIGVLAARGARLRSASARWRAPDDLVSALIAERAAAARRAWPHRRAQIGQWEKARLGQARRGRLGVRLGARDILAIPGKD